MEKTHKLRRRKNRFGRRRSRSVLLQRSNVSKKRRGVEDPTRERSRAEAELNRRNLMNERE
jgi:hypothetical protein